MGLFDKTKFPNKDKVTALKEQFSERLIGINDLPQDVLAELLIIAIERLDIWENVRPNPIDERDIWDIAWDRECLLEDLFKKLERKVELDIYE